MGKDLIIAREYLSHGIRERAAEIVSLDLGPRSDLEIEDRLRNEVNQERFTSLDRSLLRDAGEDGIVAALGGLRGHDASIPAGVNGFWENASFHNYADYALGSAFATGLQALCDAGHAQRCAIMCSEAVWWRCHRRIVSDYLIARGEAVFHIMGHGKVVAAELNPAARRRDEALVYPPAAPA